MIVTGECLTKPPKEQAQKSSGANLSGSSTVTGHNSGESAFFISATQGVWHILLNSQVKGQR